MAKLKCAGAVTRRFYDFESRFEKTCPNARLLQERSMVTLQRLSRYVWEAERLALPRPLVVAGRGSPSGRRTLSYWMRWWGGGKWQQRIVLARHQRSPWVLFHELAHAMSWHGEPHGPAFARRFLYLVTTYGGCPEALGIADEAGVL